MKKSTIFIVIVGILVVNLISYKVSNSTGQPLVPVQKQVGKLNVSIDPRMELLTAIQGISSCQNIQRNSSYYKSVKTYFDSFRNMQAVSYTDTLAGTGFSHDAPIEFMLHLSQPDACEPHLPYSNYLIRRAQGEQHLISYQKAIHEFAVTTRFRQFWRRNKPFYNQIIDLSVSGLSGTDWISVMEAYFNSSQNSYNIIFSPLLRAGYGPSIPAKNGSKNIFACLPLEWKENDIPHLNRENLMYYIWHEFGHSFVNHEVEKYAETVERTSVLFKPIQNEMVKQNYGNWTICVNEHITRAVTIRLIENNIGKKEVDRILNYELENGFIYIEPVLEKLKNYENMRKSEKITFSDFVPELLTVFDSLSKTDYTAMTLSVPSFSGPINKAYLAHKIAVIYPTNRLNNESFNRTKKYVESVHQRFFKEGLLIPDTIAVKTDLSDYGLIVYGAVENNLFIEMHKSGLPFKITGNTVIADREYTESGLRLITCLPNPQNEKLGMVIYTATANENIPDINNVFHGPEDYIIFINRNHVLKKGFYEKTDKWRFQISPAKTL